MKLTPAGEQVERRPLGEGLDVELNMAAAAAKMEADASNAGLSLYDWVRNRLTDRTAFVDEPTPVRVRVKTGYGENGRECGPITDALYAAGWERMSYNSTGVLGFAAPLGVSYEDAVAMLAELGVTVLPGDGVNGT